MKENQDWYNRRYNEDYTQRADAQRLLTMTQDAMRRNNQASAGTAAVMGGTTESVAAAKAANNQVMADTVSQIAADAANQKNAIEQQYMATKANLVGQLNKTDDKRMKNAAAMGKSIGEFGDSVASSFSSGKYNALFGGKQPSED